MPPSNHIQKPLPAIGFDDDQTRSQPLRRDLDTRRKIVDQRIGEVHQTGDVGPVASRAIGVSKMGRRAAQQTRRPLDVAALAWVMPGELHQALPQHPFIVGAVLPGRLEDRVRAERQAWSSRSCA